MSVLNNSLIEAVPTVVLFKNGREVTPPVGRPVRERVAALGRPASSEPMDRPSGREQPRSINQTAAASIHRPPPKDDLGQGQSAPASAESRSLKRRQAVRPTIAGNAMPPEMPMNAHAHNRVAPTASAPETRTWAHRTQVSLPIARILHHLRSLELSPSMVGPDYMEFCGCFSDRLELRVVARQPGPDDAASPLVFDIHGRWRVPRRLYLTPCHTEEWIGLDGLDAIAFVRGLRNDATAETLGVAAVTDGFDHCGHRVTNPFRDRFGNETSPISEYGDAYRRWRNRALEFP